MPTDQLALAFSPAAGAARRDDGISRAGRHADQAWATAAFQVVCHLAHAHSAFTTDQVWEELYRDGYSTHEPRAMGAVMRSAAQAGLIVKSDRVVPTNRTAANRRPVAIWLSKSFTPTATP